MAGASLSSGNAETIEALAASKFFLPVREEARTFPPFLGLSLYLLSPGRVPSLAFLIL